MAKIRETDLMNAIKDTLTYKGFQVLRLNAGAFFDKSGRYIGRGVPKGTADLLAVDKQGRAVWIECKVKPNKPTPEQVEFIDTMRRQGCRAGVCYSVDEALALVGVAL